MRYDPDHKARTRLRLLTEAAILLREAGPDGLSVATLMKRQGLTHGGFYAHFESKEDLIEQAIDAMFDKTCERFVARTRGLNPREALIAYADYYLSPAHINRAGQGCPVPACAGDVARLGAGARRHFEAGIARLEGLIADTFLMAGLSPADAAWEAAGLLGRLAGGVVAARAVKSSAMQDHIAHAARLGIERDLDRLPRSAPDLRGDGALRLSAAPDIA
ncbi:TetR/AcrR family transcriptional regulator [Asticcacaulis solisilvae]|uniref:TetR/AcrR family transcriptional regulator n=1 Tax=Asticcacaulis solisilvae TaxID=1217274 RepID=UPI003FD705D0